MKLGESARRIGLVALLAVMAIVAAIACGEAGDQGSGGERLQGGELTVASFEFTSLDPHFSGHVQDISLQRMIWRGLYTLDQDNRPYPAMAAEMPKISDDGKTYTIKLRDGLKWSDGHPLTAADFEFGLKRTCNPDVAGLYEYVLDASIVGCGAYYAAYGTGEEPKKPTAAELQALEDAVGVRALDDTTLEIRLNQAQPTFTIILSLWMTFPAPRHLLDSTGAEWPTDPSKLAYNGPYVLKEYKPQDRVVLEPNPYWAAPNGIRPTLDRLIIRFIDDLAQANRAFETGELEFANVNPTQLASIAARFPGEYVKALRPFTRGLQMNLAKSPLDKLEVRLALSQAIDRAELNRVVAGGGNEPTTTWLPAVTAGPAPDAFVAEIGFDPEKARQNLAKAGYPNGQGFPVLTLLTGDTPTSRKTGEFLVENFRRILGIEVKQEVVDSRTGAQRFFSGQFDLIPGGFAEDYPDPENWIVGQFNSDGTLNLYNCRDPRIDELVAKAQFNGNNGERIKQYQDANKIVSTTLCGVAPYWHENSHYLVKSYVVGMRENISGQDSVIAGDWIAEAWGRSR